MKHITLYGDRRGGVSLVETWGTELTIVNAARASRNAHSDEFDGEKDPKLIEYMTDHEHTSPFEHCGATFRFVVPLFVARQHHRHRTWAYNEVSRRYTSENIFFFEEDTFRRQHSSNRQASYDDSPTNPVVKWGGAPIDFAKAVKLHHEAGLELYNLGIEAGVCREQARGVLAQNMYTSYYGTVNLHNMMKFMRQRLSPDAQKEIRVVAESMLRLTWGKWPNVLGFFMDFLPEHFPCKRPGFIETDSPKIEDI